MRTTPAGSRLSGIGLLTVALSWAVVQTVFALRYAHEYYTPPVGGIDFKTKTSNPTTRTSATSRSPSG